MKEFFSKTLGKVIAVMFIISVLLRIAESMGLYAVPVRDTEVIHVKDVCVDPIIKPTLSKQEIASYCQR